jgi:hypothetical protein
MAVMNKQQAKKFTEMSDFFLDLLNYLREKGVIDKKDHSRLLLVGYERLVEHLAKIKVISSKDAKDAMKNGYKSLVYSLAK